MTTSTTTRSPRRTRGVVAACAALLVMAPTASVRAVESASGAEREIMYRVVDLGTLGGQLSNGFGVNDRLAAVGRAQHLDGGTRGFLWRDGQMTDLGGLSSAGTGTTAYGINNRGEVVGDSLAPDPQFGGRSVMPFYWSEATGMVNIGQDLTRSGTGRARGINDHGVAVGVWRNRAFRWSRADGYAELDLLPGAVWKQAEAMAINEAGVAVGWATSHEAARQAVRWSADGRVEALPGLPGGEHSIVNDINASGWMVGEAERPVHEDVQRVRPVIWSPDGTAQEIELIDAVPPLDMGFAEGINDAGVAVGWDLSSAAGDGRQVPWVRDRLGEKTNLNDVIEPGSGWDIRVPLDINNHGDIVGIGTLTKDGVTYPGRAFLLRRTVTMTAEAGDVVRVSGTATFGSPPVLVGERPPASGDAAPTGPGTDVASATIAGASQTALAFEIGVRDLPAGVGGVPEAVHYEWSFAVHQPDGKVEEFTAQAVRTAQVQQPGPEPAFSLLRCAPDALGVQCSKVQALTGSFLPDRVRILVPLDAIGADRGAVLRQARDGVVASLGVSGARSGIAPTRMSVREYVVHPPTVVIGIAPAMTPEDQVPLSVHAALDADGAFTAELPKPYAPGEYRILAKACLGPVGCRRATGVVVVAPAANR